MLRALVRGVAIGGLALLLLVQAVPYGRDHTNPPVRSDLAWDSPQTRALAVRACYDCHSNETVWPWYASIAPMSWLIQRDVDQGREALNFSEWDRPQKEGREAAETVQEGEMPPRGYVLLHPSAQLSAAERRAPIGGLEATFGREGRREDDDRR